MGNPFIYIVSDNLSATVVIKPFSRGTTAPEKTKGRPHNVLLPVSFALY